MAAYLYCRTSDLEESNFTDDDLPIALELEQAKLAASSLNKQLVEENIYLDRGEPWLKPFSEREQADTLLDVLASGDTVITPSLLRMFSNTEDLYQHYEMFVQQDIRLYVADLGLYVTDDKSTLPFSLILEQFRKMEKRRSHERIKKVKQHQREKGRFLGGSRPFGYMIHSNGRLIENPMEQKALKKILEMKDQGASLRTISNAVSTPMVPISYKTVQRILKRHNENQLSISA